MLFVCRSSQSFETVVKLFNYNLTNVKTTTKTSDKYLIITCMSLQCDFKFSFIFFEPSDYICCSQRFLQEIKFNRHVKIAYSSQSFIFTL